MPAGLRRSAAPNVRPAAEHRRDQHRRPGPGSGPARAATASAPTPCPTSTACRGRPRRHLDHVVGVRPQRRAPAPAPLSPCPRRLIAYAGKPRAAACSSQCSANAQAPWPKPGTNSSGGRSPRPASGRRVSTSRRDRRTGCAHSRPRRIRTRCIGSCRSLCPPARRRALLQRPQVVDVADLEPVPGGLSLTFARVEPPADTGVARRGERGGPLRRGLAQPQPAGR